MFGGFFMTNENLRHEWIFYAVFAAMVSFLTAEMLFSGMPTGAGLSLALILCDILLFFRAFLQAKPKGKILLQAVFLELLYLPAAMSFVFFNNALLLKLNFALALLLLIIKANLLFETGTELNALCYSLFIRPFHKIPDLWKEKRDGKKLLHIALGIIIAIPVLFFFLVLLGSSDAVFEYYMDEWLDFENIVKFLQKVLLAVALFMATGSFYRSMRREKTPQPITKPHEYHVSAVLIGIPLVSLSILLLLFSVVQCSFLFFGAKLPDGISYSAYAHKGFFQLCFAAFLVYIIVAISRILTKNTEKKTKLFFRFLYTLLFLSCVILCISSFYRLVLYEKEFNFTRLRIYVQFFVAMMAVLSICGIIKVWAEKFRLIRAAFLICCTFLLLLTYFNADAFIAQQNALHITPANKEESLDYLSSLSLDALPYYIEHADEDYLKKLEKGEQTIYSYEARHSLKENLRRLKEEKDLRSFNTGRIKAEAYTEKLEKIEQVYLP